MSKGTNRISRLHDWEIYPENLKYHGCNAYAYNLVSYRKQLQSDAQRIFTSDAERVAVKVIEFNAGVTDFIFEDAKELEGYLSSVNENSVTRIIMIPQQSSWGQLIIDENSFRKILSRLNIFPPFIDIVRSFGERTGYEDNSYGGFRSRNDDQNKIHETAYLVKYVEEHGRSELDDPWSVRQMGVYHQTGASFGDVFIVINPSLPFRQRLKIVKQAQDSPSGGEIHLMIMSCVMENWRWYISDVEKRYLDMKDKAQLTQVDGKRGHDMGMTDIKFDDTQEIQILQDKCQQLVHLFGMDRTILQDMRNRLSRISTTNESLNSGEADFMSALIKEADIQMSRINNLLKRLEGTIALVRTILDFRCLASLENNSSIMTEISRLSRLESTMMFKLTERAARDTEVMKILTILALVYLPASFVSSMMGMGYINVHSAGRSINIQFSGEFWIFLVLTVVLLLATLIFYGMWLKHTRSPRTDGHELRDLRNSALDRLM